MSIVVTTPTGNIGHVVVEKLLEADQTDVVVIVRDPNKLSPTVRERVSIFEGVLEDAELVNRATRGADALFWLTPPDWATPDWKAVYENAAQVAAGAVTANRVSHVVHLSSGGADRATGFGPVSFLQIVENALNQTGANVLHLRPGYFYENFLSQLESIKGQNALYLPVGPEITYPMIATHDIGVIAAQKLLNRSWSSSVLGLHGPNPTPSFGHAAAIIGEAVGRPVRLVTIPLEAVKPQLLQSGASVSVADGYTELLSALARGEQPAEPRTPETTTPTTLAQWARDVIAPLVSAAV